jgi:polysaccharide export outer membrane protein
MKLRLSQFLILLPALAAACSVSPYTDGPSLNENVGVLPLDYASEVANGEFFLGPEDKLVLDVYQNQDLSRAYKIRIDGTVLLPLVGKIRASGQTRDQFEDSLVEAYSKYLVDPVVFVDVEFSPNRKVTIMGEVNRNAVVPLTNPRTTVLDIIATAGGLTPDGDRTGVLIARRVNGIMTIKHFDLDMMFAPDDPNTRSEIPFVQAGDVLYVVKSAEAIYNDHLQTVSDTLRAMTFGERVILNAPRTSEALQGDLDEGL